MDKVEESTNELIEELKRFIDMRVEYNLQNELQSRINKAIRILNSAKNHYDNDKTNWAIERTLRVLKGSDSNE